MWETYLTPTSLAEALDMLNQSRGQARIVAGATDLILELERGVRVGVRSLIDITRLPGLAHIRLDERGWVHLGALVTHNQVAGSTLIQERASALARACWEVGAPQIRNRATVAGNVITASPANDSITPLMALGAQVVLRSSRGERTLALDSFYLGVRKTAMADDEMLTEIVLPAPPPGARSAFVKLALRRAQAISVVNVAVLLDFDGDVVARAAVTLGSVAPTIIHAPSAESYLAGKELSEQVLSEAGSLAANEARPIDDLRGSAEYRREMVRVGVMRALRALRNRGTDVDVPRRPVMLWGREQPRWERKLAASVLHRQGTPIETTINGRGYVFSSGHDKTLLRLLREEAELIGTKEGCAEGECGACTVFLDGAAVMSCMVPAPRAHGAEIVTVEGLAQDGRLHPIQHAFIEQGAVQCGYCTPGFLMSGAKLLEERPKPTRWEIEQSLTGNLCRCTGYYKILSAFERAAELG